MMDPAMDVGIARGVVGGLRIYDELWLLRSSGAIKIYQWLIAVCLRKNGKITLDCVWVEHTVILLYFLTDAIIAPKILL